MTTLTERPRLRPLDDQAPPHPPPARRWTLPALIVPFKRETYRQVLAALGPLAKRK